MIRLNQLRKKLIPIYCGLAASAFFYIKSIIVRDQDLPYEQYRELYETNQNIGLFFGVVSLSIGTLIIAHHLYIYAIKPGVNSAAPKLKAKMDAASKERNIGKATQKVKEYKELRDAGLLSESEYQTKIKTLKKLIN